MAASDISALKGRIDFGIITILEEELSAVLDRLPVESVVRGRRMYNLCEVATRSGDSYLVAVVRTLEPGNTEATDAAKDLLDELDPQWLLVVGIAGGFPTSKASLGDVVVSTRIHDFNVRASLEGGDVEYSVGGGAIHKQASTFAVNLPAMGRELGDWSSPGKIRMDEPRVELVEGNFYGSEAWRRETREHLEKRFVVRGRRAPIVTAGAIASSDQVLKDTRIAEAFLRSDRKILAVEMESAGVYRATSGHGVPALSIRGLSDIVGFKRDDAWKEYACHSAAAFTAAMLWARPIEPHAPAGPAASKGASPPTLPLVATPAASSKALTDAGTGTGAGADAGTGAGAGAGTGAVTGVGTNTDAGASPPLPSGRGGRGSGPAPLGRGVVYISFSDQDGETLAALKETIKPLEQQGLLATWDRTQIRPGEVIAEKTRAAIASAKAAVLLVSSRFLASPEREREVAELLGRGVPLLCLYVDFSLVDLASFAYVDPKTRAPARRKLVELGALNEPERPLRAMSASERSAALMRAVKKIIDEVS